MTERLIMGILLVNAVVSMLYFVMCLTHVSVHSPSIVLLLLLLPGTGVLAALVADILHSAGKDGERGINAERFALEDKIYGRVEVAQAQDIIPLTDALIIDSKETRRNIMMEILHKDPEQFTEQLKRVLDVDDTEMVHYSVTTIVEMRAQFDNALLRLEKRFSEEPSDQTVVTEYAQLLERYLSSGILEGNRQQEIRERYSEALLRAAVLMPDTLEWRLRYVENERALTHYVDALAQVRVLLHRWRKDERVWLAALDCAVAMRNDALIAQLCKEVAPLSGSWPIAAREAFAFWQNRGGHAE